MADFIQNFEYGSLFNAAFQSFLSVFPNTSKWSARSTHKSPERRSMRKMYSCFIALTFVLLTPATPSAQPCGDGGGESPDAMCPKGLCSAGSGLCGSGFVRRCGSDLTFGSPNSEIGSVISASEFDGMLKHRNDRNCEGNGFYSYEAFVVAAAAFGDFGTTGNLNTRKREVAAFLAQTSYETTG